MTEVNIEQFLTEWLEDSLKYAVHIETIDPQEIDGDRAWDITSRIEGEVTTENWEFFFTASEIEDFITNVSVFWDDFKSGQDHYDVSVIRMNILTDMIKNRQKELEHASTTE